jgi:hypothetical protein
MSSGGRIRCPYRLAVANTIVDHKLIAGQVELNIQGVK